jgi:general secretion pathway protein E/type IV pilus assembly protein PilB
VAELNDIIIDLLHSQLYITDEQVKEARAKAAADNMSTIDALKELYGISEEELMMMVASIYGMETFDFSDYEVPKEAIEAVPAEVARRYGIMPVSKNGDIPTIAISDPSDLNLLDTINRILGSVDIVVSTKQQIAAAAKRAYATEDEQFVSVMESFAKNEDLHMKERVIKDEKEATANDAPIIRLVYMIILEAFKTRASDIHVEPLEKRLRVRYRIDGALLEVDSPPKYLQNNIVSRLKLMSAMDLSEHRTPQDGRIQMQAMGKDIDLRVSCLPTVHGESIVMRILDKANVELGVAELGFFADDQQLVESIIRMPDGIFLVTGPTGSGKTTSLYAFLNAINRPTVKIITAEDPVEYELSGINQVQIRNEVGMTFAKALRAMLRQAPNIIMVGEIRDQETGEIAINAALTGHMVFSTLHTNDAPSAVTRLIDMGVKPFLIASALRAAMAQRLLRRTCKKCAQPVTVSDAELESLGLTQAFFAEANLQRGRGCEGCKKGYKGRIGIYEIFVLDNTMEDLIYRKAASIELRDRARALGMRSLRDDGLRKAVSGITTLEEVIGITVGDESALE